MTNSNNWIRVLILKQSAANAAGAKCLAAQPLAQLLREATIRLFSRVPLEVTSVPKSDEMEWLILLADAENGGEVLALPSEPVVLADGISVQFERTSEAQQKSQFEKDFVVVSKEEIREIASEIDVNGMAAEAPLAYGHLESDSIDAVGMQLQDFTLKPGGNGDVHDNSLISKSAIEMQLKAAGTVANSLCQNSNYDSLIVSKEEIVEADSKVGVNGSVDEASLAKVSADGIGKQFDGLTLTSAENDNIHENGHVAQSDTQTQLSSTQATTAIAAPFCQTSNDGAGVDVNLSKQLGEILQATINPNSTNHLDSAVNSNGGLSGSSHESRDEENIVEQTTMKFWQFFVGDANLAHLREKLCAISNTLFPDTQQLNAEQIQQLLSIESRDLPPPLIRVAEVLLSKARRYQPWHDIVEKLDDFAAENDLGFAVDSKGLMLLLQYYLPPVKARQLYQRLAEQNSTLPFAALLPINNGSDHQSFHLLTSHFRNLFVANIPILLSIGLLSCTGKSTFLNKCFDCEFPQSSENGSVFHSQSIDVSLSTESKPQSFHVFDCHGDLSLPVVQLLSSMSSIVLVHVALSDLKDKSEESQLQQFLAAIASDSKILVLVRDCTESAFSKIQLPTVPESIQSKLLGVIPVMKIESDSPKFKKDFPKFLDSTLKPLLDPFTAKEWPKSSDNRYFSLYEQIEAQLLNFLAKSPVPNLKLIARSDRAIQKSNHLKELLRQLPEGEGETRRKIFPRSDKFAKLCEKEASIGTSLSPLQHGEDMKLRAEMDQLKSGIRGHKKLDQLLSEILAIAQSKDLETYEEFLAILAHFKFVSEAVSAEPVSSLPTEFFWRELLLFAEYLFPKQKSVLQEFLQILLAWGYPIEIINGDTLTFIDPDFLAGILTGKEQKKLLVVSVVGQQSTGKSTLMNHLFGSGFAVSAGRCTKGMHLSIFETSANERIAVLDSEGLMSVASRGTSFDKQMAVMLLALSHVVLINVKGEIGIEMNNILEANVEMETYASSNGGHRYHDMFCLYKGFITAFILAVH